MDPAGDLDAYRHEMGTLQIRNGKIHAEIWKLGKQAGTDDQIFWLGTELEDNKIRIRTLKHLIAKTKQAMQKEQADDAQMSE